MISSFVACSNSEPLELIEDDVNFLEETGFIEFLEQESTSKKNLKIFYHIPEKSNNNSPIVFVFHGGGRNAKDYRDAMIAKSNEYNFIIVVPEFSNVNFPGGDGYNLGNVFVDGDNPSTGSLNTENEWAFSLIEPVFAFFKEKTGNTSQKYHIIGHSAGAQFLHRFAMFKPDASFDKAIISAAGWYTVPNLNIDFPYGLQKSPLESINLSTFLSKNIKIIVGELDNNPNAGGLRRNSFADAQGINRFQRAYHFFNESKEFASKNNTTFNWNIQTNFGLNHDFRAALQIASDLLFND